MEAYSTTGSTGPKISSCIACYVSVRANTSRREQEDKCQEENDLTRDVSKDDMSFPKSRMVGSMNLYRLEEKERLRKTHVRSVLFRSNVTTQE